MKKFTASLGLILLMFSAHALSQQGDCSACAFDDQEIVRAERLSLCDIEAVREGKALYDEVNEQTKPLRRLYEIVKSPQGFLISQFSEHVFPIPEWVGYLTDPKGAVRGFLMDKVRSEAKKAVGLDGSCIPTWQADEAVWLET